MASKIGNYSLLLILVLLSYQVYKYQPGRICVFFHNFSVIEDEKFRLKVFSCYFHELPQTLALLLTKQRELN